MVLLRLIPIGQVYASEEAAKGAADALMENGFDEEDISLITPSMIASAKPSMLEGSDGRDTDSRDRLARLVVDVHEASAVPERHAAVYAEQLRQGRSLVLVTAGLGEAGRASDTLGTTGEPVDFGELPELEYHTWMQPAPLSALLNLPVLSRGRSWMASTFPELKRNYLPTAGLFGGLLSDKPTPLSSALGWPLLKREPTPLSSKFGWKLLWRNEPAPLSSRLGIPVLAKPRPIGDPYSFGTRALSRNPAPLSSLLGLPVLTRPRTTTDPNVTLEKRTTSKER